MRPLTKAGWLYAIGMFAWIAGMFFLFLIGIYGLTLVARSIYRESPYMLILIGAVAVYVWSFWVLTKDDKKR